LKLCEVIAGHVEIKQKAIRHTPIEKLQDAFIAILSGAHGLSEMAHNVMVWAKRWLAERAPKIKR